MDPINNSSKIPLALATEKGSKAKLFIWLAVSIGLITVFLTVIAYLFVYVPNKPENVYRRGMESIGVGLQFLVEPEFLDNINTTQYKGQITVRKPGLFESLREESSSETENRVVEACLGSNPKSEDEISADLVGYINLIGDNNILENSLLNFDLQINEEDLIGLEARVLGSDDEDSLPKIFFQFDKTDCMEAIMSWMEEEGGDNSSLDFAPLLGSWWSLDFQELLDEGVIAAEDWQEFKEELDESLTSNGKLTQKDYKEAILIAKNALQEYIFTSDTEKMVFEMDELLDDDADYEGVKTKKYSAILDEDNTVDFLISLYDGYAKSEVYKKVVDEPLDKITEEDIDELRDNIKDFKEDIKIEVLVDSKSKILRNIRFIFTDKSSDSFGSYFDLGFIIDTDNEVFKLQTKITLFSDSQCGNIYSPRLEEDKNDEGCPYTFEERECPEENPEEDGSDEEDSSPCGRSGTRIEIDEAASDRCYDGKFERSIEKDNCLNENQRHMIFERTLKSDAKPFSIVEFIYEVNAKDNTTRFELTYELVEEELIVEVKMEIDSQAETPEITEPASHRSIIDFIRDRVDKSNAGREADIGLIKEYLLAYVAENGQFPVDSIFNEDFEDFELNKYSYWDIEYYTSDAITELFEVETLEEDEDTIEDAEDYYTYTLDDTLYDLTWYPQMLILAGYECSDSSPQDGYDNYEEFQDDYSNIEDLTKNAQNAAIFYSLERLSYGNSQMTIKCESLN